MSTEKPHEQKEQLEVDVLIPGHDPRKTTALFLKTKRLLMKVGGLLGFTVKRPPGRCWICQRTEDECGPLEAHHFGVERCYIQANLRWDLIQEDFPMFDWKNFNPAKPEEFVDNMASQGILLCKEHHTGKDTGIHMLPWNIWIMQRYLAAGEEFNPNEIIIHDRI